ncbi:MAG: HdeD family acid-resistance protein [Pseudonocardiaceae bacterium]
MTESFSADRVTDQTDRIADQTGAQLARVGRSRGWTVALGALTLVAGILLLVWPGQSILVLAVILGIWLLVAGVFRLVAAVALDEGQGSSRVLIALLGVVAILVGILCLARPFQTATALALLLGAFWIVAGVIEFFHGIAGDTSGRGWAIAAGLVSVIAGIVVLAYPGASLVVLTWLFGIWLIVLGAVEIAAGFSGGPSRTPVPRTTRAPGPVTP